MLEAENGKVRAEAEKRVLEMTVQEGGRKLNEAEAKLTEAEVDKQLLEKEYELKLKMKENNATSAIRALERKLGEAERNEKKMDEIVRGLNEELEKVSELVKELEASNSDRDSLAKKYQDAEEAVRSELAQTQTE